MHRQRGGERSLLPLAARLLGGVYVRRSDLIRQFAAGE
jgi:hypothetical protein